MKQWVCEFSMNNKLEDDIVAGETEAEARRNLLMVYDKDNINILEIYEYKVGECGS